MDIFIYTLHLDGRVIYVGQSANPKQRLATHRRRWRGISMEIVRSVQSVTAANRIEGQVMDAYQRRGEAMESRLWTTRNRPGQPAYRIGRKTYSTQKEIADAFGFLSVDSVRKYLRTGERMCRVITDLRTGQRRLRFTTPISIIQ